MFQQVFSDKPDQGSCGSANRRVRRVESGGLMKEVLIRMEEGKHPLDEVELLIARSADLCEQIRRTILAANALATQRPDPSTSNELNQQWSDSEGTRRERPAGQTT